MQSRALAFRTPFKYLFSLFFYLYDLCENFGASTCMLRCELDTTDRRGLGANGSAFMILLGAR